jgi:hypothetical protein
VPVAAHDHEGEPGEREQNHGGETLGPGGHGMRFGVKVESGFAATGEIAEHLHDGIADEADADGGEAVAEWGEVRRWRRSAHALTEENRQREEASGGETRMFHEE